MEQSPYGETESFQASQGTPKVRCSADNSPQRVPVPSQMNPVPFCVLRTTSVSLHRLRPALPIDILPSGFPTDTLSRHTCLMFLDPISLTFLYQLCKPECCDTEGAKRGPVIS